jgi:hypothetical protein
LGHENVRKRAAGVKPKPEKEIRAADAKEVGVGNPAEETYCHPNTSNFIPRTGFVNWLSR